MFHAWRKHFPLQVTWHFYNQWTKLIFTKYRYMPVVQFQINLLSNNKSEEQRTENPNRNQEIWQRPAPFFCLLVCSPSLQSQLLLFLETIRTCVVSMSTSFSHLVIRPWKHLKSDNLPVRTNSPFSDCWCSLTNPTLSLSCQDEQNP